MTTNKNSRVNSRIDRNGNLRTETCRRDENTLDVAVSTDLQNNRTRVFIDAHGRAGQFPYAYLELNGREARTLYLTLQKHFACKD